LSSPASCLLLSSLPLPPPPLSDSPAGCCVDASTSCPLPPLVRCRRPHHSLFLLFLGRLIHSIDVPAIVVFVTAAAVADITVAVAVAAATTIAATIAAFFTSFVITATTVNTAADTTFAETAIAAALLSLLVAVVNVAATLLSLSPPALPSHQLSTGFDPSWITFLRYCNVSKKLGF
jgi:hypothetical protein